MVIVAVSDINDNPPFFIPADYVITVLENTEVGRGVGDVEVKDRDEGRGANITFSLSGSGSEQ